MNRWTVKKKKIKGLINWTLIIPDTLTAESVCSGLGVKHPATHLSDYDVTRATDTAPPGNLLKLAGLRLEAGVCVYVGGGGGGGA